MATIWPRSWSWPERLSVGAQRRVAVATLELPAGAAGARVVAARAGELVAAGRTPAGLDARAAVFGRCRVAQPLGPAWPEPGRQAVAVLARLSRLASLRTVSLLAGPA